MAYSPIAFTAPNYRDYKNEWIKAYEPGTTTPKDMATDSTLMTFIAKAQLNQDGFIVSAGGALIIPYIDGAYDLWLFPTEAEADANDTSNALRIADNITGVNGDIASNRVPFSARDLDEAVNETNTKIAKEDNLIYLEERTIGNGGGGLWKYVDASSVTPNTFNIVACTGVPSLALVLQVGAVGDVKQFGAVADGLTDDAPAAQASNAESKPLSLSNIESDIENTYGKELSKDALLQNNTTGRLYNPKSSLSNYMFGMETLQHWFDLFKGTSNVNNGNAVTAKIVCTGDSTTAGVGGTYGGVPAILNVLAQNRGYSNVSVVNNGQSAQATIPWPETGLTNSWKTTFLAQDIAEDPDLLIVRWGANDPFYNVSPLGDSAGSPVHDRDTVLDKVITGYREALTLLRNSTGMGVEDLSIILATPGPMNDVFFGRDEVYFQRLSDAMRQMALDYQCAFVDIYGLYSNSWGGVNDWYDADNTSGTLRAIHPHDALYEHIAGAIAELALPNHGVDWQNNQVRNSSGTSGSVQDSTLASSFVAGININRMGDGLGTSRGAPYNGSSLTLKQSDGSTTQLSFPLNSSLGAGMSMRQGWNSVWNTYWNGAVYNLADLTYQNGWSDFGASFEVGSYKISLDGTVSLSGVLSVGTTTNATLLFTLPLGFRPSDNVLCLTGTENGDCLITIAPTGAVTISRFGSGGSYILLNGVTFPVY